MRPVAASDTPAVGESVVGNSVFGNSVARRWAPPGPRTRPRPAPLGSVAAAAVRFSAGLGQVPQVRRQLAGPKPIRAAGASGAAGNVAPPRWWVPAPALTELSWGAGTVDAAPASTGRLLRRAVGPAPTLQNHRPGAATAAMAGKTIPVRRVPEVTFAGNMKGAASKLVPPRAPAPDVGPGPVRSPSSSLPVSSARSKAVGPPGPTAGDGGSHRPAAGAVPRSDALRFGAASAARTRTVRRQQVSAEPAKSAATGVGADVRTRPAPTSAVVVPGVRNRWSGAARAQAPVAPQAARERTVQVQPSAAETANVVRRAWSRPPASSSQQTSSSAPIIGSARAVDAAGRPPGTASLVQPLIVPHVVPPQSPAARSSDTSARGSLPAEARPAPAAPDSQHPSAPNESAGLIRRVSSATAVSASPPASARWRTGASGTGPADVPAPNPDTPPIAGGESAPLLGLPVGQPPLRRLPLRRLPLRRLPLAQRTMRGRLPLAVDALPGPESARSALYRPTSRPERPPRCRTCCPATHQSRGCSAPVRRADGRQIHLERGNYTRVGSAPPAPDRRANRSHPAATGRRQHICACHSSVARFPDTRRCRHTSACQPDANWVSRRCRHCTSVQFARTGRRRPVVNCPIVT